MTVAPTFPWELTRQRDRERRIKTKAKLGARVTPKVLHPKKNRRDTSGWPSWAVPVYNLREFIHDHRYVLESETPGRPTKYNGWDGLAITQQTETDWINLLTARIERIMRVTPETAMRRVYAILNHEQAVIGASWAEAACFAVGKYLDDTNIPTLPGNKLTTRELIEARAAFHNLSLSQREVNKMVTQVRRLNQLIIYYPHNTERLVNLAPLDCLRPYR